MTDYLYAHPSFLGGMARVLDIFGVFTAYNYSRSPQEADARAIHSDWLAVGKDLDAAMADAEVREEEACTR
ncbi:MAG: hypothetical protein HY804_01465 [Nitrospinae bacterium]|nr:hypothetical protein [Nitrospinota bacterium]